MTVPNLSMQCDRNIQESKPTGLVLKYLVAKPIRGACADIQDIDKSTFKRENKISK
jgi:hypothetical protein